MGILKIPIVTFLYIYTFFQIKLSHQADKDVRRLTLLNNFLVEGINTLTVEKCPDGSEFVYLQAFAVCRKKVNFLSESTQIWLISEHEKPADSETEKNEEEAKKLLKESKNQLIKAYYNYCQGLFDKDENCDMIINKETEGGDRFTTEAELDCKGKGQSVFNGTLFCIEKSGSPVEDKEEVSLVGFDGFDVKAKCPDDKKIKTITAFKYAPPLVNKGMVESMYEEVKSKCDGNDQCTLKVKDKGRFKNFIVYTYKCMD